MKTCIANNNRNIAVLIDTPIDNTCIICRLSYLQLLLFLFCFFHLVLKCLFCFFFVAVCCFVFVVLFAFVLLFSK